MFSNFLPQFKNKSVANGVGFYVSVNGCESLCVPYKVAAGTGIILPAPYDSWEKL